jgi:hypothetical protein
LTKSSGEGLDDFLFSCADFVDIDFWCTELDTPTAGQLMGFFDNLRDMEKGFRGDTASKEASATEFRFALDDHYLMPFVGREESSSISAGTTTKDNDWNVHLR